MSLVIDATIVNVPVLPSITAVEFGCVLIVITRKTVTSPCVEVILDAAPTRDATTL